MIFFVIIIILPELILEWRVFIVPTNGSVHESVKSNGYDILKPKVRVNVIWRYDKYDDMMNNIKKYKCGQGSNKNTKSKNTKIKNTRRTNIYIYILLEEMNWSTWEYERYEKKH